MKKAIIVIVVLAVLAGGAFLVLRGMNMFAAPEAAPEAGPEATITGEPIQVGSLVVAEAKVVPVQSAELSLPTGGLVTEVLVVEGNHVEAGQAILRLNAAQQAAAVVQAEAQLQRAQAQLDELKAGARQEQIAAAKAAVEVAQARLAQVKEEAYPEEIAAARAELAAVQARLQKVLDGPTEDEIKVAAYELHRAELSLKQAQEAYDEVAYRADIGLLPQAVRLEQATINYETALASYNIAVEGPTEADIAEARSRVAQAQDALARLLRGASEADVAAAEAEVRRAQAELDLLEAGERAEAIAKAEADVAAAQAELGRAKAALADAELRAPFSGTVVSLDLKAGEYVAPGVSIAHLADLSAWEIETDDLTELGVVDVHEGDPVIITVDAFPGLELTGRVTRIKAIGEDKQGDITYTVIIKPDQQDNRLRWNMTAAVSIGSASEPTMEESITKSPMVSPTGVPATEVPVGLFPTATPWPSTETEPEMEAEPTSTLPPPTATSTPTPIATPASLLTAAPTPTTVVLKAEVVAQGLNVRSGPGTDYSKLGHLKYGQEVEVIGRDPATGWLQIAYPEAASGTGWISGKETYVRLKGSLETAPIVSASGPTPTPAVLASSPTPTPLASSSAGDGDELSGKLVFQTASGGGIYSIDADGTGLRRLAQGLDPTWSPDGDRVAFARWDFPYGLYVVHADGTGERQIFGAPQIKAPDWSPDGTRLVFTYQHEGNPQSREECLKNSIPGEPDSVRDCFEMSADPWWKLGVVRLGDGSFSELYSHDFSYSPTWSPDGTRIAYASDEGLALTWEDTAPAVSQNPNAESLSQQGTLDRSPAWSPDGMRFAFQHWSDDHYEIMVMNADGAGRTPLTESPAKAAVPVNSVSPAWSPDGQRIVYLTDVRGRWELFVMNADGSGQRPLFEGTLDDLTFEYQNLDERVVDWGP